MPRTNRFTTEFPGRDGKMWVAEFSHLHDEKEGVHLSTGVHGKYARVQHITTCKLFHKDKPSIFVRGISPCSLKDTYDWRYGIERSFQKCLEKLKMCVIEQKEPTDKAGKVIGPPREVVEPLKEDYGFMMRNFFFEQRIKAYPPHTNLTAKDLQKRLALAREALVSTSLDDAAKIVTALICIDGPAHITAEDLQWAKNLLAAQAPTGVTPPENRNGLMHTGAD